MNWLVRLFCPHKWEIIGSGTRRDSSGSVVGNFYDCRCSLCGRIKEFRT